MDGLFVRSGIDHRARQPARLAAEQSVGRKSLSLRQVRQLALVGQEAQVAPDAAAAPELAGAGRVGNHAEALDDDRLGGLLRFHRDVRGVERPRHPLAAVAGGAGPGAREDQLVGHEATGARPVPTPERRVGEVRGGGCDALGQGRRQRAQHGLECAIADDRPRPAPGRRSRVQERAGRRRHRDRPQGALVHRSERIGQALHGRVRVRARVVDVGVHAGRRLRARAVVVDGDGVAGDGDRHPHAQRLGAGPVVVQEVLEGVDAVGDAGDRRADAGLAARDDLVHRRPHGLAAVALDELDQAQLPHPQGAALGTQIAEHLLRRAGVGRDDPEHALVLAVRLPHARGRDPQPFLEIVEDPLHALAAGAGAADVGVVDDVDCEADQRAVVEGRLRDEEVREVAGAEQRIVEEDRVPGPQGLDRMRRQRVAHRCRHGAHVPRRVRPLGDHAALGVEDRHREVLALARLLGVRGLLHRRADLDGDRLQRAPDHAERDGVERRPRHHRTRCPVHGCVISSARRLEAALARERGPRARSSGAIATTAGPRRSSPKRRRRSWPARRSSRRRASSSVARAADPAPGWSCSSAGPFESSSIWTSTCPTSRDS